MKVQIEDLTFNTILGILPFEREFEQRVIVNLSFEYTYDEDDKDFVDYSLVANDVKTIMKFEKFKLIEEALLFLKKELEKKYYISGLDIKISKPDILDDCKVSVTL
jgi:dihydroneopterin aldolase